MEVDMVSFKKEKESWEMDNGEKLSTAQKKKEEGNALYKIGKFQRASKKYSKAVKLIEYDSQFGEDEKKQSKVLQVTCRLNDAACKLKLKEYKEAVKLTSKVLETEASNVKALYRRAQAYIQQEDYDLAEWDVKKALDLDPDNRDLKLEYKTLKQKVAEQNKKEAKIFGNMFARLNKLEAKESKRSQEAGADTEMVEEIKTEKAVAA
eukprot:TRINITY_DN366_c0_g1_i4.p1 TRINITY_DN366_c0_g1~~TRINITY_DN366_c0_g1_i4.p1  ORF type:complete len:207 (+),score=83.13 TRINITY_DN366_c0_g1_i4:2946-3566(+)